MLLINREKLKLGKVSCGAGISSSALIFALMILRGWPKQFLNNLIVICDSLKFSW